VHDDIQQQFIIAGQIGFPFILLVNGTNRSNKCLFLASEGLATAEYVKTPKFEKIFLDGKVSNLV
jgi:hypothetical protein